MKARRKKNIRYFSRDERKQHFLYYSLLLFLWFWCYFDSRGWVNVVLIKKKEKPYKEETKDGKESESRKKRGKEEKRGWCILSLYLSVCLFFHSELMILLPRRSSSLHKLNSWGERLEDTQEISVKERRREKRATYTETVTQDLFLEKSMRDRREKKRYEKHYRQRTRHRGMRTPVVMLETAFGRKTCYTQTTIILRELLQYCMLSLDDWECWSFPWRIWIQRRLSRNVVSSLLLSWILWRRRSRWSMLHPFPGGSARNREPRETKTRVLSLFFLPHSWYLFKRQ
jgi:hypothetical protein